MLSRGSDVEVRTLDEAARAASLPSVPSHVAMVPDAHAGFGPPIGTEGAVIPYAIGVDIGCGMIATETDPVAGQLPESPRRLMLLIEERIPAGMGEQHTSGAGAGVPDAIGAPATELTTRQRARAAAQSGTLGSVHVVEVCLDERDRVWLVLHSGSRGVGQLAQRAVTEAKGLTRRCSIDLPDPDLAHLVHGTADDRYVADMQWAQRYALASRQAMMTVAETSLFEVVGRGPVTRAIAPTIPRRSSTTTAATCGSRAGDLDVGDLGVIPSSMGTRSSIVERLGSEASCTSCSHGAGRRMSRPGPPGADGGSLPRGDGRSRVALGPGRGTARRAPQLVHIDAVMADQVDLARPLHTTRPVLDDRGCEV